VLAYILLFVGIFTIIAAIVGLEKAENTVANAIASALSTFGINFSTDIFENFASFVMTSYIGQLWLVSYFAVLCVVLYNIAISGEAWR